MSGDFEWIFWVLPVTGGLIAASGIVLTLWALLGDRSRGRRRCPKCWYDMTATPGATCSECGHSAKREKKLKKTRRHLWPARLGVMVTLVGLAGVLGPRAAVSGPPRIVPTTALILLMPGLEDLWPAGAKELASRCGDDRLWSWQWRMLTNRASEHGPFCRVSLETRETWPEGVVLAFDFSGSVGSQLVRFGGSRDLRFRIIPRFDPDAEAMVIDARRALARTGLPPGSGQHDLEFEIQVERRLAWRVQRSDPPWQVIHTTTARLPVRVQGTLAQYAVPEDSPSLTERLKAAIRVVVNNRTVTVDPPDESSLLADLAFPVIIELLCDREPVASWLDWWGGAPTSHAHRLPVDLRGDRRPFGPVDYACFDWSVRIRGDASRAVLRESERFWAGELVLPLRLVDTPQDLAFRWP